MPHTERELCCGVRSVIVHPGLAEPTGLTQVVSLARILR